MKRLLYLLSFFLLISRVAVAQEDEGGKVHERMREYLQKRLDLTADEANRFGPVFLNYFKELRRTNQEFKGDRLVLQQKIADLRLRYRDQFKGIMGEKRSNDVFVYERDFVKEVQAIRKERLENGKENRPTKRIKGQLR
jgi:hypothetical protein